MACDVQSLRDDASCLACAVSSHDLLAMAVVIACAINQGTPMACDVETLRSESRCLSCSVSSDRELLAMLVEQLCALSGGGGGGGVVAVSGENFCFTGALGSQVLKIKNTTTGLANRVNTVNPDGTQAISLDDGSAC